MVEEIWIWDIFVLILLEDLSDEDADSDTAFDPGHSKTDTFGGIQGDGVVGEGKPLIVGRLSGLGGISSSYVNAISFELRAIDNEELKFEDGIDIFVDLVDSFNVALLRVVGLAGATEVVLADERRDSALFIETNFLNVLFIAAGDSIEGISHSFQVFHEGQ